MVVLVCFYAKSITFAANLRFGWSVKTYAKIEDTHQQDFLNMITVNLAELVYGSPELFGMGVMDEFFRAHSKVDRVLQVPREHP